MRLYSGVDVKLVKENQIYVEYSIQNFIILLELEVNFFSSDYFKIIEAITIQGFTEKVFDGAYEWLILVKPAHKQISGN